MNRIPQPTFLKSTDKYITKELFARELWYLFQQVRLLCVNMFRWDNLPVACSARALEQTLFDRGLACFVYHPVAGIANMPCTVTGFNFHSEPSTIRADPLLSHAGIQPINVAVKDCVLVRNNEIELSTHYVVQHHVNRIADVQMTIAVNVNAQKTPILLQGSKKTAHTLQALYEQYNNNKPMIFGSQDFDLNNSFKVLKTDAPYVADKLYILKMQMYSELLTDLGIRNNPNYAKRERLITDESGTNDSETRMFNNAYYTTRRKAADEFNNMWAGKEIAGKIIEPISVSLNTDYIDEWLEMNLIPQEEGLNDSTNGAGNIARSQ